MPRVNGVSGRQVEWLADYLLVVLNALPSILHLGNETQAWLVLPLGVGSLMNANIQCRLTFFFIVLS